jgi:hypothetical protein
MACVPVNVVMHDHLYYQKGFTYDYHIGFGFTYDAVTDLSIADADKELTAVTLRDASFTYSSRFTFADGVWTTRAGSPPYSALPIVLGAHLWCIRMEPTPAVPKTLSFYGVMMARTMRDRLRRVEPLTLHFPTDDTDDDAA